MSTSIEYDDLKLDIINNMQASIEIEGMRPVKMKFFELTTGKLFISLRKFEGFIFLDKYNNLYDTTRRKINFYDGDTFFEGDKDKEAFSLFENYKEFEKKLKMPKKKLKIIKMKIKKMK